VLAYHSLSAGWDDPLCVDPQTFAEQMQSLASRGYRGVTFGEAARATGKERLLAITFDDAFASVVAARPVLDGLGWPATVFAPTVPVETQSPMRWLLGDRWSEEQDAELLPLTWQALAELRDAGWEIGSHSRTHPRLSELADDAATEELAGSRAEIESRLGSCTSVSYPWGEVDDRLVELARQAGYTSGSGLVGGRRRGPLAVPRFAVAASDGELHYALKTSVFVWRARESGAWRAVDYLRHGRHPRTGNARTALVLDGNTGPGLAVTRSLGRAGWRVLVPAGSRSSRSRLAHEGVEVPDAVRHPDELAAILRDLAGREEVDLVVPTTDASLEVAWDALGSAGVPIAGGDAATVRLSLDKAASLAAAEQHGFPVPAWRAPATIDEARAAIRELGLPCVVKPRRSFRRVDGAFEHRRHAFVESDQQLEQVLAALGGDDELPLLQEFVPGRAVSTTAVVQGGRVVARIARETFTFHPVAGGTSVWKRTIAPSDAGVEDAVRLLVEPGLEGVAEVEYQVGADGVPRFMEIGARLHGWVPLAVAAGVDLPVLAAAVALGEPVRPVDAYRVGLEMRWPAGEVLRARDALLRSESLPPGVSRADVLSGLWPVWKPGMRYDGIDLGDLKPWLRLPPGLLRPGSR
jgi:peptidoglycan/xylan/chitin deacetylase (PgdA/CDA1 family)/predicted ATP-grasp superfamily ATP-dependent carboligase